MRVLAWFVVVIGLAAPATAQREFIEEVDDDPNRKPALDDVDLDAPDVDAPKDPKTPKDPKDPKTTPTKDPKATDPKNPTKDPKATDPKAPPTTEPEKSDVDSGFEIRPTTKAALIEKLKPRAVALAKGELARARKQLGDVEAAELDFGIHGTPGGYGFRALGLALAKEAEVAFDDGRADDAVELVEAARRAAPDDLATTSQLMHERFHSGDIPGALTMVGDVVAAVRADPAASASVVARASAVAAGVILALLLLVSLVSALPALRLLAFDVWVFLPRGSHVVQGYALVGLAAAAPVVAGAGPVLSLLWLTTLGILYMPKRARVVAVVCGFGVAALPTLAGIFSLAEAVPSSDAQRAFLATFDVDGDDVLNDLRRAEAAKKKKLTLHEAAALATSARREGRIDEALERWKALLAAHGDVGWVHGGYGTALADAGQDDLALAEFGLAIERSDAKTAPLVRVVAAFNASLLHHKAGRIDKAQQLIAPAATENAGVVAELRRATFRAPDEIVGHNRAFVDVLPPRAELVRAAFFADEGVDSVEAYGDAAAVLASISRALWHGILPSTASMIFGALAVLWAVLAAAAKKLPVACACVRCGSPASRRVDGPDVPGDTCAACFHVFLSSKSRVEATVKLRKERAIFLRGRRRARIVTALSLFPGAGHLFAGAGARGAAFAFFFALLAFTVVAVVDAVVPGLRPLSAWSDVAVGAPFAVVAVGVFLIALRSALGVADDERAGGRL